MPESGTSMASTPERHRGSDVGGKTKSGVLYRPYIDLYRPYIFGRYLQFRILEWPLKMGEMPLVNVDIEAENNRHL